MKIEHKKENNKLIEEAAEQIARLLVSVIEESHLPNEVNKINHEDNCKD